MTDVLADAVAEEVLRRIRVEEQILRYAFMGGVATVSVEWPDEFGPTKQYVVPTDRAGRRRVRRLLREAKARLA